MGYKSTEAPDRGPTCPGCMRPEIHKSCPAHGTEYYMSGKPFTIEVQIKLAEDKAFKRGFIIGGLIVIVLSPLIPIIGHLVRSMF